MMEHARHLSSPSPTSPFLFHHSERSFKSNSLTPLLSSTADVTSVDDCFATAPPSLISHHNHNHNHNHHLHNHNQTHNHHSHHQNHNPFDNNHSIQLVDNHHSHHNQNNHQRINHNDQCVTIDQDSLTGVDDDDGMHNMLSGSSTSSTSTMPLLTESHSHHSYSRISLEEYSPLSLVEDCDNALPISPTSLACGSHHHHHHHHHHLNHFKTSLNGLKMDNLDGENDSVGGGDGVGNDDVNDARSLSPSLLSTSANNNHHNLWSNSSSTAITQNTSLLNNTSTSFLLSHHHHNHPHHQLNSLIQQLEPQSLDEPAGPLMSTNNFGETLNHGQNQLPNNNSTAITATTFTTVADNSRPSSEPPQGSGLDLPDDESKSLTCQPVQTKSISGGSAVNSKSPNLKNVTNNNNNSSNSSSSSRSRKSRSRSSATNNNNNVKLNHDSDLNDKKTTSKGNNSIADEAAQQPKAVHSSKLHLQLNHQKKLQELQQRLFGTVPTDTAAQQNINESTYTSAKGSIVVDDVNNNTNKVNVSCSSSQTTQNSASYTIRQEPDSSAEKINDNNKDNDSKATSKDTSTTANNNNKTGVITRSRPVRARRSRVKNDSCSSTSTIASNTNSINNSTTNNTQRLVTTEKAEPDTTTKTSDCIKLADLLSTTTKCADQIKIISTTDSLVNGIATITATAGDSLSNNNLDSVDIGEKRVQQIQLQLNPSLTVVANGGLMQSMGIQQQGNNGTVLTTNQILCRPQTAVIQTTNGQLKGLMSSNELLKSGETTLTNWSFQANNQTANNNNSIISSNNNNNNNGQATIGAHQIAIQVICQDGTSLVLPVSSTAGLNAAVSLSSQHQQIQAVLANNASVNQQQRNNNNQANNQQLLPLMSVSNIVAQQQFNTNDNSASTTSSSSLSQTSSTNPQQQSSGNNQATSGLAASSPTLAALLDASSIRNNSSINIDIDNNNNSNNNCNYSSQSYVSTNLLRKLVSGNTTELKQGLGLTNSLLVCPPSSNGVNNNNNNSTPSSNTSSTTTTSNQVSNQQQQTDDLKQIGNTGEKRIKLENAEIINNIGNSNAIKATTITLIDNQGRIVANSNERSVPMPITSTSSSGLQLAQQLQGPTTALARATIEGNIASISTSNNNNNSNSSNNNNNNTTTTNISNKQNKMGSSTGNRQVDPTQPFRCEHCNSTFTRLGNFTRHKKIHTVPTKDGQRFKCDVCSKSFLQRCDLARHLHIHRGTEPHRCNICGKGYIRHSDLVTHQRFHNKEKPFGCPHCSKGFCQRGDLNRHLRSIHLQMKPILCPCCNRKFAKQETLLRHLNTAHRSRPGTTNTTNGGAVSGEMTPTFTITTSTTNNQPTEVMGNTIAVVSNPLLATTGPKILNQANIKTEPDSYLVVIDEEIKDSTTNTSPSLKESTSNDNEDITTNPIPLRPVDPSVTTSASTIAETSNTITTTTSDSNSETTTMTTLLEASVE